MVWLVNPYRFGARMPSGPYSRYRTRIIATESVQGSIPEMEMALTSGGANICTGGTAIYSGQASGYEGAKAFDANMTTRWQGSFNDNTNFNSWIGYQWAAPVAPAEWRLKSGATETARMPTIAVLEGSNDGTTWVPITFFVRTWAANETHAVSIPGSALPAEGVENAVAWRVYCDVLNGGQSLYAQEVAFAATPGGATLCTGGKALWSTHSSAFYGGLAFDGNGATHWEAQASQGNNSFIGYAKASAWGPPVEMRYTPEYGGTDTTPRDIRIQWTSDFQTWHDYKTFTGLTTGWTGGVARAFDLT